MQPVTKLIRFTPALLWVVVLASIPASQTFAGGADFSLGARSHYTDNLLLESDQRLENFANDTGPGQRFQGLERSDDVVTRVRGTADFRWQLNKRSRLNLELDAGYFFHLYNDIADYARFGAGLTWSPGRRNHIYAGAAFLPDRFKKNYRLTGEETFAPAFYRQHDVIVGYKRDLRKHWSAGLDYRMRSRRFDDLFADRNYDGDYLGLFTDYRLGGRVKAETVLEFGQVDSSQGLEQDVIIDRSNDRNSLVQQFQFRLTKETRLSLQVGYRLKDYTTGEEADQGRYKREDRRLRGRLDLRHDIGKHSRMTYRVQWTDNNSDRLDPTVDTDEVGYQEFEGGVSYVYRF